MEVSKAEVLITVDGARRKGKTAPIKAALDAVMDARRGIAPDRTLVGVGVDVLERVVAHTRTSDQAAALTLLALIAWSAIARPRRAARGPFAPAWSSSGC